VSNSLLSSSSSTASERDNDQSIDQMPFFKKDKPKETNESRRVAVRDRFEFRDVLGT
jgi:hypothetical protein